MRAASCIGRVGGLAVALGVGAAVATGAPGVASAAPSADTTASDAANPAHPVARGREAATEGSDRASRRAARHNTPAPAAATPVPKIRLKLPSPSPVVIAAQPRPAETAPDAPSRPTPRLSEAAATVTPPRIPAAVPTPAPATSLKAAPAVGALRAVPTPFSTSGPSSPAEATAGWVVLAAARRSSRPLPGVPAAAAVSTGLMVTPTASAKTASIFGLFRNQTPTLTPRQSVQGATGSISGDLNAADADGDAVTYTVSTNPAHGSVQVDGAGRFTYTPDKVSAHTGVTDQFTVTASDAGAGFHIHGFNGWLNLITFGLLGNSGHTTSSTVTVTVTPVNTAPTGALALGDPDAATGVVTGRVVGSDSDGDPLRYSGSAASKGAVAVAADGGFAYTPTAAARHTAAKLTATAADRTDEFTITVSDGQGGSVAVPVSVSVLAANVAPMGSATVGSPDPSTGVVAGAVAGRDADADPLTYVGTTSTAKGAVVVGADGTFTYRPTAEARHRAAADGADPTDTFTVTISDGHGGTVAVPVTVSVSPVNAAPVVASLAVGGPDSATGVIAGLLTAADADGDALAYKGSSTSKGSATAGADGAFTYTPTATARHAAAKLTATGADKTDTFTVTVSDSHGGAVVVPVSAAIAPSNATPLAELNAGTLDAVTGVVAGAVLGTDADGDPLSYTVSTAATKGAVVVSSAGGYTYTPTAFARHLAASPNAALADVTDSFVVTVADGYGGTVDVPVTVAVSPASVTFSFVYGSGSQYWTDPARTALASAAARLASVIVVGKPVNLSYDVTADNTLGSGFLATSLAKFGSGSPGYYGTVVQTKMISGADVNGAATDGQIAFNFAYPWALGDTVPANQYDFQSVAMHELLHTFGVMTGLGDPSSIDRNWTTYDRFLSTANGTPVIGSDFVWNSAYAANLTGGNGGLYFDGPNAVAAYGGPVPLYTPGTWKAGSSLTHLDPAGAPPGTTYLMDPTDGYGPGVRALTPVEVGLMKDLGFTLV